MIYEYFGTVTEDQLNLLRLLYYRKNWIKIEQLENYLKWERKKVIKIANELQSMTREYEIAIVFEKGKGYRCIGNKFFYKKAQIGILEKSVHFILLDRLFKKKYVSFMEIIEENYISESSLRKIIRYLNRLLEKFHLKIRTKNGFVYFSGKETQIRSLGYQFYWSVYRGLIWPFEMVSEKKIQSFINKQFDLNRNRKMKKSTYTYVQWCYVLALNICRYHQMKIIHQADLPKFLLDDRFKKSLGKYQKIYQELYQEFYLPPIEVDFLFLLLQTKVQFYMQNRQQGQSLMSIHKEVGSIYDSLCERIMKEIQVSEKIPKFNQQLAESTILASLIFGSTFKGFMMSFGLFDQHRYIKNSAPRLIQTIKRKIENEGSSIYQPILEEQSVQLGIAKAYGILHGATGFERPVVVSLETDMPIELEFLLCERLNGIYQQFFNVNFFTVLQVREYQPDLYIHSIDLDDEDVQNRNTIYINPQLTALDIEHIYYALKTITNK